VIPESVLTGVELLCLDAGNTVIFLDHARVAEVCTEHGFPVTEEILRVCEGEAKRRAEDDTMIDAAWKDRDKPGGGGWGRMVGTMLFCAGAEARSLGGLLDTLWAEHCELNLWRAVPTGFLGAATAFKKTGGKIVIVSNSEGMLAKLFARLEITEAFDHVVDSGLVGLEKPDPRIFDLAREKTGGVGKEHTLHLGDVFATDIKGARAAGVRCALIDPFNHYQDRHAEVPRVPGAVEVLVALTLRRQQASQL
jgi:putative hydrolase of the HAD superfamily